MKKEEPEPKSSRSKSPDHGYFPGFRPRSARGHGGTVLASKASVLIAPNESVPAESV